MKRAIDLVCSLAGLIFAFPFLVVIAWIIRRQDGGPAFYRQTRVGYRGTDFRIWKFRTMVVNADKIGPSLTSSDDPRVTSIGKWLRKTKLDELPQLINVLFGEMSLVGPRPEVRCYVDQYQPHETDVLSLIPGVTDPASLEYFEESRLLDSSEDPDIVYVSRIMPEKIRINLEYAARATVFTDAWIILKTIGRVATLGIRRQNHSFVDNVKAGHDRSRPAMNPVKKAG